MTSLGQSERANQARKAAERGVYATDFDFPVSIETADSVNGSPVLLGFDVVDAEGCYLTERTAQGVQQILLTTEQIEWLHAEGLPAVLEALDA